MNMQMNGQSRNSHMKKGYSAKQKYFLKFMKIDQYQNNYSKKY